MDAIGKPGHHSDPQWGAGQGGQGHVANSHCIRHVTCRPGNHRHQVGSERSEVRERDGGSVGAYHQCSGRG